MKIIDSHHIAECIDSVAQIEFRLNEPIDEQCIQRLSTLGQLEYFAHFPRPFFRVNDAQRFQIKGVLTNNTFTVVFYHHSPEDENAIRQAIEIPT